MNVKERFITAALSIKFFLFSIWSLIVASIHVVINIVMLTLAITITPVYLLDTYIGKRFNNRKDE